MNTLIAKVKDKRNPFRKANTNQVYFDPCDLTDTVEYKTDVLLEEKQWFKLENFKDRKYCLDFIKKGKKGFSSFISLDAQDIEKVEYICAFQNDDEYCFQKINKSHYLKEERHLVFGKRIQLETKRNIMVLNQEPDAVYSSQNDSLYFKKLDRITSIFNGIDELFREATKEEVIDFLKNDFINPNSTLEFSSVGKNNRKRLVLANEKMNDWSQDQKKSIFEYISGYYPKLGFNGTAFTINSDNDLKCLLFGIEERFYTTPVTKEDRVANYTIRI